MTWYQRILREPILITALVVAVLAFLKAFGLDLNDAQHAAVLGLVAAVLAILSRFVTPSSEVIAQQKPGEPVRATAKAEADWGISAGKAVHVNPARTEAGRFHPLAALVLAFLMTVAGALFVLAASPAQAAGWSGVRCDNQVQSNASKVCVDVHTIPSGNGLKVDQVEVCAYKVPGPYANGLRATFNNAIYFRGGAGAWIDGKVLDDTGASQGGSCSYTNMAVQLGKSACYVAGGTMDIPAWADSNWSVSGGITGGAWDCP